MKINNIKCNRVNCKKLQLGESWDYSITTLSKLAALDNETLVLLRVFLH